jgi:L-lysine exporter family protein LysE/ArgO
MKLLAAAVAGFLLGGSLIVAIGAQNAFVLRQGLRRKFVFPICLVCALADAALIAAGIAGLGTLVAQSGRVIQLVTIGGALFLFAYGVRSFFRALKPEAMEVSSERADRLVTALAACLAFTFLNPHVYLDTVLLIGSLSGRYAGATRLAYGVGATAASFVWFFGLGYGAALLAPVFADRRAWRVLDVLIGVVMWLIVARLAAGLLA